MQLTPRILFAEIIIQMQLLHEPFIGKTIAVDDSKIAFLIEPTCAARIHPWMKQNCINKSRKRTRILMIFKNEWMNKDDRKTKRKLTCAI